MAKLNHAKKFWTAPELTVYGSVSKITGQDKKAGGNDGIFLVTVGPIQNNS